MAKDFLLDKIRFLLVHYERMGRSLAQAISIERIEETCGSRRRNRCKRRLKKGVSVRFDM
ncbi:hypothetical protein AMJ40_04155 [candidate division TA06 bacterium DG_26]|uniref:Uncharacterized protein n=1 Tax=candidate division TA06 bacterium DG_26 TaxID=1703771 RepID=A0A0S7WIH8_UNCT6|nr:MAG: hypothetical protein AMJ40_04155 [candidate division TA06 bacterium DG_26]